MKKRIGGEICNYQLINYIGEHKTGQKSLSFNTKPILQRVPEKHETPKSIGGCEQTMSCMSTINLAERDLDMPFSKQCCSLKRVGINSIKVSIDRILLLLYERQRIVFIQIIVCSQYSFTFEFRGLIFWDTFFSHVDNFVTTI